MKTILDSDDRLWARLKATAAREGKTVSELVEAAVRSFLKGGIKPKRRPPLPTFNSGGALVDVADRDVLYRRMGGR